MKTNLHVQYNINTLIIIPVTCYNVTEATVSEVFPVHIITLLLSKNSKTVDIRMGTFEKNYLLSFSSSL